MRIGPSMVDIDMRNVRPYTDPTTAQICIGTEGLLENLETAATRYSNMRLDRITKISSDEICFTLTKDGQEG